MARETKKPKRLDLAERPEKNGHHPMPRVKVVERPDPAGERWRRALELLLEAGRGQESEG